MFARLIKAGRRAFGLQRPGRNLKVLTGDTFLVSFPNSGNTWVRFLVANLLYPNAVVDFKTINALIRDPEITAERDLLSCHKPRVIKSHQYFDPRYEQVIYIVHDPRDVVVSQYHFQRKRRILSDEFPLPECVHLFIAGKTCAYGSWGDNVGSWLATRGGSPGFLIVRYEDLIENTVRELTRIGKFLSVVASDQQIERAVKESSADNMRRLEQLQSRYFSSTKDTRQDIPFVRVARASNWHQGLPQPSAREIAVTWSALMNTLGYAIEKLEHYTRDTESPLKKRAS